MILTVNNVFKRKKLTKQKEDEEVYCSNISDFLHGL